MADTTSSLTMAKPSNYWIASNAIYITLNAMGSPDYIQGSVASGAQIMCYFKGIDGLGYDAGHNYRRWPLAVAPTYFNTTTEKYLYVAVPKSEAINDYAQVVFPSEQLDVYGKNADGTQVGSTDYYYIWLQGIISASVVDGKTQDRTWTQRIITGYLASDEAIAAGGEDSWWRYSSVDDTVEFLKTITKAVFENLTAKIANITQLVLGGDKLFGIAKYPSDEPGTDNSNATKDDNNETVVTPKYFGDRGATQFISKTKDDSTNGFISFLKGLASFAKSTFWDAVDIVKNLTVGGDASVAGNSTIGGSSEITGDASVGGNSTVKGNSTTDGNASVGGSLTADDIHSRSYSDSLDQSSGMGYHIWVNGNTSNAIFDNLSVRGKWTASVLEVMKLQYSAGNITIDGAGGEIFAVEPFGKDGESLIPTDNLITTASAGNLLSDEGKVLKEDKKELPYSDSDVFFYRCYFKATDGEKNILNMWHVGDQARCQTFNLSDGTHLNAQNKTYFRVVINKSDVTVLVDGTPCFYIDLSNVQNGTLTGDDGKKYNYRGLLHSKADDGTVTWLTNDAPEKGDQVAHVGNVYDEDRQGAVQLVAVGAEKGLFIYDGINETLENLADFLHIKLTPRNSLINTTFITYTNGYHSNNPYIICGDWTKGVTAHPSELWQHNGSSWICNKETTTEPSEGNDAWSSFAHKGEKGESITKTGEKIEYTISNSGTETPKSGWQTTIPSTTSEKPYLWTRSTITLSSGDPIVSYSVARQGADGKPLKVSAATRYHKGDKPTSDSGYELTEFPSVGQGDIIWNITITTYTNPDTNAVIGSSTAYGCSRIGTDGDKGAGVHIAYATSADGKSGFSTVWFANATYLGVCVNTDTDDPEEYTAYKWSKIKGEKGEEGVSSLSFTTDYSYSQSQVDQYSKNGYMVTWNVNESTAKAKVGDSVSLRITNSTKGRYEWIVGIVVSVPSDKSLNVKSTGIVSSGVDGTSVTITSRSVSYQISDSATTIPTGEWSKDIQQATDAKPYLWTKTVVNYSDNSSTTSYSVSYKGKDGDNGNDAVSYYINPQAVIVAERLDSTVTDIEKKYTSSNLVYDIPSLFAIHKVVGATDTIVKADTWSGTSKALPDGWSTTLQNSFTTGKGYNLTSIITASKLRDNSDVNEIVLTATVGGVALTIAIYINRLGTTQTTTYGDTTETVRMKVLTEVDKNYVKQTVYDADVKATSERFTQYYNRTEVDGKTNSINKMMSAIDQKADSISLRVSSQRTGRNLWINGDFEMDADKAPKYSYNLGDEGGNIGTNEVDLPAGFNKRLAFKCSKAFQGIYYNGTQPHLSMKKGTTYCLSFFAKATSNTDVVTGQIYYGLSGLKTVTEDITGAWKRYAMYFTADKDYAAKDIIVDFYPADALADASGNAGYICLTGIQFETGSQSSGAPTVWSKGYETEDAVTELKQTVDGISSTVQQHTTGIKGLTERQTKLEQTSTEISSTVTEQGEKIAKQETEIKQTPNNVKVSVRNEEKEAGLEITANGVKLNGDKTEITGDLKLGGSFWGVLRRKAIIITADNYTEYISVSSDGFGNSITTMKLETAGSYVIFDKDLPVLADKIQITLPTIPRTADGDTYQPDDEYPTFEDWAQYARTFVGTRIMAYNYSPNTVVFYGMPLSMDKINTKETINGIPLFRYDSANGAFYLYTNCFAAFECAATFGYGNTERADSTPEERIVWNATGGLMADKNSKYVQAM